jgi:hypothetical protein
LPNAKWLRDGAQLASSSDLSTSAFDSIWTKLSSARQLPGSKNLMAALAADVNLAEWDPLSSHYVDEHESLGSSERDGKSLLMKSN